MFHWTNYGFLEKALRLGLFIQWLRATFSLDFFAEKKGQGLILNIFTNR